MSVELSANQKLAHTIAAVSEQLKVLPSDKAAIGFRAETELVEGVLTRAKIRDFILEIDEPPSLGGTDKGPNPVELILAALGTCQEIVYSAYAAVLGIELKSVKVKVEGKLDPRGLFNVADVSPGFLKIQYETEIESPAAPSRIKGLVDAVESHCPVLDTLLRPIEVSGKVSLDGQSVK